MQFDVRPLTPADFAAADAVLQAAFARPISFLHQLQWCHQLQPGSLCGALVEGRLVATGAAINYGQLAHLGLMAVAPDAQRQGWGGRVLTCLLERLDQQRCPTVLLDASLAGEELYERHGFRPHSLAKVFQAPPRPLVTGDLGLAEPAQLADLDALIRLDQPCFGANRGHLLHLLLERYVGRCWLSRDARGELDGFLVARERFIGPWVARNVPAARRLLRQAAAVTYEVPPQVSVPRGNQRAWQFLHAAGFQEVRQLTHMRRGAPLPEQRPDCLWAHTTFGLG